MAKGMSYGLTVMVEEAINAQPDASFIDKGRIAARIVFPEEDVFFGEASLRVISSKEVRAYVKKVSELTAKALNTRSAGFKDGFEVDVLQRWNVAKSKLPEEIAKLRLQCIIWRAESLVKRGNAAIVSHGSNLAADPYHTMFWSDSTMRTTAGRKVGKIVLQLVLDLQDPENQHIVHVCEIEKRIVREAFEAGISVGCSSSMSQVSMRMCEAQIWGSFGQLVFGQLMEN